MRPVWTLAPAVALVAALGAGGPGPGPVPVQVAPDVVEGLQARCAQDNVRQTCRAMGLPVGAAHADTGVIVVAGLGAVDGALYHRLLADGRSRCATVARACRDDWDGAPCRSARAAFGTD